MVPTFLAALSTLISCLCMYTYKAVLHTKCIVLMTQMAAVVIALQWKVTQYFMVFIWRKKEDCLLALKYSFLCVLYVHIFPLTFIIKCPDSILEPDKERKTSCLELQLLVWTKKFSDWLCPLNVSHM